jgi:tetratricopeptide (TPR) repeat protein
MIFPFDENNLPEKGELKIAQVQDAIQQNPNSAILYQFLGRAYLEAGNLHQAELAYSQSLALDDSDGWTHMLRGNLHYTAERYDKALKCFREASQLMPDIAFPVVALADTYNALGDYEQTGAQLHRALEIEPDFEMAL